MNAQRNYIAENYVYLAKAMAGYMVYRYRSVRRRGYDECLSDCMLALLRAAEHWDPDRIPFEHFALFCMRRYVLWETHRPQLHAQHNLHWEWTPAKDNRINGEDLAAVREASRHFHGVARDVFRLLTDGVPEKEIAPLLGITRQHVNRLKHTGIEQLREKFDVAA